MTKTETQVAAETAAAAAGKSIIDPKYRNKYRGEKDWVSKFIDGVVEVKHTKDVEKTAEDGTKTTETVELKKTTVDLGALFKLSHANGIDATGRYGDQVERLNATGRLRMTLGNMLRAAAKKRHGLFNLEGEWVDADEGFINGLAKSQNPDGSKIVVAKPEAGETAPTGEGETAPAENEEA